VSTLMTSGEFQALPEIALFHHPDRRGGLGLRLVEDHGVHAVFHPLNRPGTELPDWAANFGVVCLSGGPFAYLFDEFRFEWSWIAFTTRADTGVMVAAVRAVTEALGVARRLSLIDQHWNPGEVQALRSAVSFMHIHPTTAAALRSMRELV
jgi:hypothetical protein